MILTSIKRMLLTVLVLIAALFSTQSAYACHLAAADINIRYIGPNSDGCSGTSEYKYEIELTTYYACITCSGVGAGRTWVYYRSLSAVTDGLSNFDDTGRVEVTDPRVNTTPPTPADTVHQLCGQFKDSNSCAVLPVTTNAQKYPGFRVWRRTGVVTLPYARKDWQFWWSESARSNSNVNLGTCGALYVEAGLDNLTKYNNSTVKFMSNPLPYICVNQPKTYLNSPYDENGDSINVEVQTPFTGSGNINYNSTACTYNAPSTPTNPIGSPTGFFLNKLTGSADFTPAATGQFVFAFRGEDYIRNTSTRLSYVYRDVQVSVLPCQAPPPNIDTLSQGITSISNATVVKTKSYGESVFVCPGSNMSLSLSSKSVNQGGKIFMYANTNLFAGSSFTTTGQGSENVVGTFNWTPDQSKIGEHTLIIESKDSTCLVTQPIVLISYRVVLIKVVRGIDAGPDLTTCQFNPQPVQMYVYGTEDLRVKWTDINGGQAKGLNYDTIAYPKATTGEEASYIVSTPDLVGSCKSRDTIGLYYDRTNGIVIKPQNPVDTNAALVMCRPGYLQLEAFPQGRGRKDNVKCGVTDPEPCPDEDTSEIYGSPVFAEFSTDSIGDNAITLHYKLRTIKSQFLIRRDEFRKADMWSSTLKGLYMEVAGGTKPTHVYGNVRMSIKCTDKQDLRQLDGFETEGMTEVYNVASQQFADGEQYFPFSVPYNLDTTKNLIIQFCYSNNPVVDTCGENTTPPVFRYSPTMYTSGLLLEPIDSNTFTVCDIDLHPDIRAQVARPKMKFVYCETKALDFITNWYYGEQLSDTTNPSALAYVPKSTYFVAQTIGRSGCIMRDTLNVYIPEHDIRIEPADTAICLGDKAPFTIYGGHFFKWYEYENGQYMAPVSVADPKAGYTFLGPDKTTEYRIVVSDSVFCYDTIAANVKILPLPNVRILNEDDTVIKYGQSFKILATGARYYNWSPVSSLNNPNISYPIARPTEDTKYIVGGIGANGCRAFDTLHVIVDKRDNLFVPSAFSPNGDGKNDLFKITNLSIQRIMEFRVFNRWGQEVFSTNDTRGGWDGTVGGVPQEMGTYTYLIRVAYPDGFVETYKGETTLIR